MMNIIIPSKEIEIISHDGLYRLRLTEDKDPLLPVGHDIVDFTLSDFPECLEKVHIYSYNQRVVTFDKDDFSNRKNLFPEGYPLSLAYFVYTDVVFEYNSTYVASNSVLEIVDEYRGDYFDDYDQHMGYRITRKTTHKGRKLHKIIKGATAIQPKLEFNLTKSYKPKNNYYDLPVWTTLILHPEQDKDYIKYLVEYERCLQMKDGSSLDAALTARKQSKVKVQNFIRFTQGVVVLVYEYDKDPDNDLTLTVIKRVKKFF